MLHEPDLATNRKWLWHIEEGRFYRFRGMSRNLCQAFDPVGEKAVYLKLAEVDLHVLHQDEVESFIQSGKLPKEVHCLWDKHMIETEKCFKQKDPDKCKDCNQPTHDMMTRVPAPVEPVATTGIPRKVEVDDEIRMKTAELLRLRSSAAPIPPPPPVQPPPPPQPEPVPTEPPPVVKRKCTFPGGCPNDGIERGLCKTHYQQMCRAKDKGKPWPPPAVAAKATATPPKTKAAKKPTAAKKTKNQKENALTFVIKISLDDKEMLRKFANLLADLVMDRIAEKERRKTKSPPN